MFSAIYLADSMNFSSSYKPDLRLRSTALLFQVTSCMLEMELEPGLAAQLSLFC